MFSHPITSRSSAFASFDTQQSNEISFFLFVQRNVPCCDGSWCEQRAAVVYAHILYRFCWIANMYDCNDVITHGPIRKEIHSKICLTIPTTIERLYKLRQFETVFSVFVLKHGRTLTQMDLKAAAV